MESLTIGQIRGIDLRVHPSFGLVLLWVVYHFGLTGERSVGAVVYGLLLVALVFGCVVLHELGHSFMAREFGIRVRNITLFPFGGVAFIEQMPMRPLNEVLITIAGPAVNVAIAAALLPVVFLVGVVRGFDSFGDYLTALDSASLTGICIYLFFANITIALFNLLPAFPMDGGRLARAGLTKVLGRDRATNVAVGIGLIGAIALAGLGIWWGELMLPLLSIFVIVAAYGEGKAVRLESAMRRLRVGQFALWDGGGISPQTPLSSALRQGPRDIVVTDHGQVLGMLWGRDVLKVLNGGAGARSVAEVMDPQFFAVDIDDSVYDVQRRMHDVNRWAVPVTDGGQYRGIFTAERFVHVYRYLNAPSAQRRRVTNLYAQLQSALRGLR